MSETNGIVTLEELPEKEIFVELDKLDKVKIKEQIREKKKFSLFLIENELKDWFYDKTEKLRLDKFKEVLRSFNIPGIKIKGIVSKQGLLIQCPKFPFDFTTRDGVRFIACTLGDGCIHDKGIRYYNKDKMLISGFINFSKKIFGCVPYKKYKNQTEIVVSIPKIFKKIVERIGLRAGPKTSTDPRIPTFIFFLTDDKKLEFISQFIDDDGYINDGNIGIDLSFDENKHPFLLYDFKKLLKGLNINCSIFSTSEYYSLDGKKRRMWRLGIFLFKDAKKLARNLKLTNLDKKRRCKELLKLNRKELYRDFDIYLQKIKELQKTKEVFTVVDLADISNRSIRHSRRITKKARELGFIRLVESACKGYKNISYATYQVVE